MKKHNPNTPIMMREAAGTPPRVFARYGMSNPLRLRVGDVNIQLRKN
jgi:hypothetical protein